MRKGIFLVALLGGLLGAALLPYAVHAGVTTYRSFVQAGGWVGTATSNLLMGAYSILLGSAGVQLDGDGDGALEVRGLGNGSDECAAFNLDDTANTLAIGNCASSTGLTAIDTGALNITTTGTVTGGFGTVLTATKTFSKDGTGADCAIVGTASGSIGDNTNAGCTMVAAPGSNKRILFLGAYLSFTFATAAYTGAATPGFIYNDDTATVSNAAAATSFTSAANRFVWFIPATGNTATTPVNKELNFWGNGGFTDPGTAAGTATMRVFYMITDAP